LFYLDSLHLKTFRNYNQQFLKLHPQLNVITGENAQGKTNLIESIYYLSVTRSFRTNRDQELAQYPGQSFLIKGVFSQEDLKHTVEINYDFNQLKVYVDGDLSKRYEHLQRFPVIIFSPDDLLIIREGPATRRKFINLEASRLSRVYFSDLKAYHRILIQRNQLLKQLWGRKKADSLLETWDENLVKYGSKIISFREKLIRDLEREVKPFFSLMTGEKEELELEYVSSFPFSQSDQGLENTFREALSEKREQEYRRQSTAVGPHLDDVRIMINGFDSRKYSSQGQKRTAALALKVAEVNLFSQKLDERPIILLDDVFSELDLFRKEKLFNFLSVAKGQCFLTTALDLDGLRSHIGNDLKILMVKEGIINSE